MYVQRNTETRSRNHCCTGKAITIMYYECVSVALLIQHAKSMRRIVICGLSGFTIFFRIILQTAQFWGEKIAENKMCFYFLKEFYLKHFFF